MSKRETAREVDEAAAEWAIRVEAHGARIEALNRTDRTGAILRITLPATLSRDERTVVDELAVEHDPARSQ